MLCHTISLQRETVINRYEDSVIYSLYFKEVSLPGCEKGQIEIEFIYLSVNMSLPRNKKPFSNSIIVFLVVFLFYRKV